MSIVLWAAFALAAVGFLMVLALWLYGRRIPIGHVVAAEVDLKRSPQQVYDLIADVPGHAGWAPRVKSVTPIEPHQGHPTFRMAVDRQIFVIYVSKAEPNKTFTLTIVGDRMFTGNWTWDITPTPTGVTVRLTERGEIFVGFVRAMLRVCGMEAKFLLFNLSGMAKHFGEPARARRVA